MEWLKILHITGIVFWMGTLLLVTRIQAWGTERPDDQKSGVDDLVLKLMMGGALPGFLLVVGTGIAMLAMYDWAPLNAKEVGPRFHIKLTLVVLLMVLSGLTGKADIATKNRGFFGMLHGVTATLFLGVLAVFYLMVKT